MRHTFKGKGGKVGPLFELKEVERLQLHILEESPASPPQDEEPGVNFKLGFLSPGRSLLDGNYEAEDLVLQETDTAGLFN